MAKVATQEAKIAAARDVARSLLGARLAFPTDPEEFFFAHIRPSGHPWSFLRHEYLETIISDSSPHIVIQKAAQMGCSTVALGLDLQWSALGYKVGYYLSDRDFMQSFVQDRLDPLINADALLSQATLEGKAFDDLPGADRLRRKSADNLRIKHIGAGSAWFMGLQKRKDVKSLDLDAYILDEVDEVDQELAIWLQDRLLHSDFKRRLELSQPSVPDWGIAARYDASDQKVYLHRCPRCRTWHCLEDEWPDCFRSPSPLSGGADTPVCGRVGRASSPSSPTGRMPVLRAARHSLICLRCSARLSGPHVKREWVARHPGREVSGYRLSQLYGPAMTPAELSRRWQPCARSRSQLENFTISILGLPFPGDRQPLSEQVLEKACGDWPLSLSAYLSRLPGGADTPVCRGADTPVCRPLLLAGIDVGDLLHVVIGVLANDLLAVAAAEVISDDWDRLGKLLAGVDFFVIDAMPYKSQVKKLLRAEGMNGAMSYLNSLAFSVDFEEKDMQIPVRVVKNDRTTAIDDMCDEVLAGALLLPSPRLEATQLIKRHCKALVKDLDLATGKMAYKRKVENHFGMALTYLVMAKTVALSLGLGPRVPLGDPSTWRLGKSLVPRGWYL